LHAGIGVLVAGAATNSFMVTITVGGDPHGVAIASRQSCIDVDEDGYGLPGDASCPNGAAEDCRDDNPDYIYGVTFGVGF
jgi:hypothetical protein